MQYEFINIKGRDWTENQKAAIALALEVTSQLKSSLAPVVEEKTYESIEGTDSEYIGIGCSSEKLECEEGETLADLVGRTVVMSVYTQNVNVSGGYTDFSCELSYNSNYLSVVSLDAGDYGTFGTNMTYTLEDGKINVQGINEIIMDNNDVVMPRVYNNPIILFSIKFMLIAEYNGTLNIKHSNCVNYNVEYANEVMNYYTSLLQFNTMTLDKWFITPLANTDGEIIISGTPSPVKNKETVIDVIENPDSGDGSGPAPGVGPNDPEYWGSGSGGGGGYSGGGYSYIGLSGNIWSPVGQTISFWFGHDYVTVVLHPGNNNIDIKIKITPNDEHDEDVDTERKLEIKYSQYLLIKANFKVKIVGNKVSGKSYPLYLLDKGKIKEIFENSLVEIGGDIKKDYKDKASLSDLTNVLVKNLIENSRDIAEKVGVNDIHSIRRVIEGNFSREFSNKVSLDDVKETNIISISELYKKYSDKAKACDVNNAVIKQITNNYKNNSDSAEILDICGSYMIDMVIISGGSNDITKGTVSGFGSYVKDVSVNVMLSAVAEGGYEFDYWTVDGTRSLETSTSILINTGASHVVYGYFVLAVSSYTLASLGYESANAYIGVDGLINTRLGNDMLATIWNDLDYELYTPTGEYATGDVYTNSNGLNNTRAGHNNITTIWEDNDYAHYAPTGEYATGNEYTRTDGINNTINGHDVNSDDWEDIST